MPKSAAIVGIGCLFYIPGGVAGVGACSRHRKRLHVQADNEGETTAQYMDWLTMGLFLPMI